MALGTWTRGHWYLVGITATGAGGEQSGEGGTGCGSTRVSHPGWQQDFKESASKLVTSLVAQWLRICLPIQGIWIQALVREDPREC